MTIGSSLSILELTMKSINVNAPCVDPVLMVNGSM
jgi:hypothetical protein